MNINNQGYTYDERVEIRQLIAKNEKPGCKYFFKWKMSFLEYNTWVEIKGSRLGRNFTPEYPVGRFFVDFGDPSAKIAIECDSRAFHTNAAEKDKTRQMEIESTGWLVFRFNTRQILINKYEEIIAQGYQNGRLEQEAIDNNASDCIGCFLQSSTLHDLMRQRSTDPRFRETETEDGEFDQVIMRHIQIQERHE